MLDKIKELLAVHFDIDTDEVNEETSFREDLGIDSLDLFEMVMELETEYGFEIPAEDLQDIHTVGDIVEYLQDKGITG